MPENSGSTAPEPARSDISRSRSETSSGKTVVETAGQVGATASSAAPRTSSTPLPDQSARHAEHLHSTAGAIYAYAGIDRVFQGIDIPAVNLYFHRVLQDLGNPTDPIERVLIEQILMAHHNVGRLYAKAAHANHLEAERVYLGAAALLAGELRRTALAFRSYKTAKPVESSGDETCQAAPSEDADPEAMKEGIDSEISSVSEGEDHVEVTIPLSEPAARGNRSPKPSASKRVHRRRA